MIGKRLFWRIASQVALAVTLFTFNQAEKPTLPCTKKNQGLFWPLEANQDPRILRTKAAAGELWMCRGDYDWDAYFIQTSHSFKWRQVTVRVQPATGGGKKY